MLDASMVGGLEASLLSVSMELFVGGTTLRRGLRCVVVEVGLVLDIAAPKSM